MWSKCFSNHEYTYIFKLWYTDSPSWVAKYTLFKLEKTASLIDCLIKPIGKVCSCIGPLFQNISWEIFLDGGWVFKVLVLLTAQLDVFVLWFLNSNDHSIRNQCILHSWTNGVHDCKTKLLLLQSTQTQTYSTSTGMSIMPLQRDETSQLFVCIGWDCCIIELAFHFKITIGTKEGQSRTLNFEIHLMSGRPFIPWFLGSCSWKCHSNFPFWPVISQINLFSQEISRLKCFSRYSWEPSEL